MTTLSAAVACDCNVPFGHHSYIVGGIAVEIDVIDASVANTTVPSPSAQCDVVCAASVPVPPAIGGSGGDGSESAAVTDGVAGAVVSPGAGGSVGDVPGGAAGTAGMAPLAEPAYDGGDSSGCAVSRNDARLLPLGILAALGLLAWRRKK
jgi:hypothetical protein